MTGHIFIYGGIGSGLGEVSIKNVKAQIDPQATNYVLHIVSPGGDVFEGFGIYNILNNLGKPIETHIEGLCASIATLVAFAGKKIVMNKTAEFMIHNPKISDLKGESSDLRSVADQLDKIKSLLVNVSSARVARNGKSIPEDQLKTLYDNETWLTSDEAVQYGFVDESVDAIRAVATVDLKQFKKQMEKSKDENLLAKFVNWISKSKIKNDVTETLQDGRVVVIMGDGPDYTGAPIVLEDGTPLGPGDYVLASGSTITVDETGVIVKAGAAEPPQSNDEENKDMENKIAELEAQLAEAKAAKASADAAKDVAVAQVTTAEAKATKFENRLADLEKKFIKLTEEAGKTVGDQTEPDKGPVIKNVNDKPADAMIDAMAADLGQAYITSRPSNYNRK